MFTDILRHPHSTFMMRAPLQEVWSFIFRHTPAAITVISISTEVVINIHLTFLFVRARIRVTATGTIQCQAHPHPSTCIQMSDLSKVIDDRSVYSYTLNTSCWFCRPLTTQAERVTVLWNLIHRSNDLFVLTTLATTSATRR